MLCLHGHGSNNDITKIQIETLLLREVHGVSCDLLHAEMEADAMSSTFHIFSDKTFHTWFRFWWLWTGNLGIGGQDGSLTHALRRVMAAVREHGPYDGIFGFSQGGVVATALCTRTVYRGLLGDASCPFRFAILANSGLVACLKAAEIVQMHAADDDDGGGARGERREGSSSFERMQLPIPAADVASFHLIGETDWFRSSSEALAHEFGDSTTYVHASGHELPIRLQCDGGLRRELARFLRRFSPSYVMGDLPAHLLRVAPSMAVKQETPYYEIM